MTELYLGTMDALWEMTPGLPIFFVEGGGQGGYKGARVRPGSDLAVAGLPLQRGRDARTAATLHTCPSSATH